ncbi:MAG: hypothetical protein JXR91_07765 [Deltaproteobacteria bacterium]|nr:hypothetical protein [Deltaproteobacteria bacterium]
MKIFKIVSICIFLVLFLLSATVFAQDNQGDQSLPLSPETAQATDNQVSKDSVDNNHQDGPVEESAKDENSKKYIRDHKLQGVVNILFGTGWYMTVPYDKNDPNKACGYDSNNEGEPFCTGRSSMFFDFLAGFGVIKGLELVFMYRQGLEQPEIGKPQPRFIGAGIKAYKPSDGLFKIGIGVIPLFDFSKRDVDLGADFVIHVPILAQFDIVRWFGAYAQIAPNISFVNEFKFDINFGIGVQARFP